MERHAAGYKSYAEMDGLQRHPARFSGEYTDQGEPLCAECGYPLSKTSAPPANKRDADHALDRQASGFLTLLHAHDYVWFSDWPAEVTREALKILWKPVCRGEV